MKKRNPEFQHSDPAEDAVDDALRRSASKVNPDPGFVEQLAARLERARRTLPAGAARRVPPSRQRWFALAGAVGALTLIAFVAWGLLNRTLPASPLDAPEPEVQATVLVELQATVLVESTQVAAVPASPAPTPTVVETEPPFAADLPPAVVTAMPGNGEEVNLQAGILVRFTQPMDRESVERALRVTPEVDGTFVWSDDRTVTFGPKALASGVRYSVSVAQEARAANGLPLNQELVFAFTTVEALTVTHTSPANGAKSLRGDTPLLIAFNYPVVPINCTGQVTRADCAPPPLEIVPEVAGQGMWVNSSTYRFDPAPAWEAGVTYNVTLPAGYQGLNGASVQQPAAFTFTTVVPRVQRVEPAHGIASVPLETGLRITFNTPMDPGSTEAAFRLTGAGIGPVPGRWLWEDGGTTLVFTPTTQLSLRTSYTVLVGTSARSLSGAPLDRESRTFFTTVPPLSVASIGGRSNGREARLDTYAGVEVRLEGLLDLATLQDHVEVRRGSEVIESSVYWSEYGDEPYIYVHWEKDPGARYCVAVLPALADRYGNTLGQEHEACFIVNDMPATFAPIIQQEPFTLDASEPARLYFSAVNLRQTTLTLARLAERDILGYELVSQGQILREWTVRPEGARNETAITPVDLVAGGGALPTGYYSVVWEPRSRFYYSWHQGLRFVVVDRHVMLKMSADEALVWVTDLQSGLPVGGEVVRLVIQGGAELGRGTTDADGIARFAIPTQNERWEVFTAIAGTPGTPGFGVAQSRWNMDVSPWAFGIPYSYGEQPAYRAYLHTDRPIYRPGQTLSFHGIVRTDLDDTAASEGGPSYGLPEPGTEVRVELHDSYSDALEEVWLRVSEMGTIEGAFELPDNARLGTYQLAITMIGTERHDAWVEVAVSAYRKPEFEVTVTPQEVDWLNGETVRVLVEANYYAGGVVDNARVRWSLRAGYYAFTPDLAGWWAWGDTSRYWSPWQEFELVEEGEGVTDAAGRLLVTIPANLAPLLDQEAVAPQRWVLEATVTDETAFAVTQRGEMTVHTGRFYLGLLPRSWVARAGEEALVDLLALDWSEDPVPNQPAEITLARRTWTHTPSVQPYHSGTWSHKDTPVATSSVTTGSDGKAIVRVTPPSSGSYVLMATSTDVEGNRVTSETMLWVSGPEAAAWRMAEGKIEPVADAQRYQPGEVARILLPTPFRAPFEVLMTIERGGIIEMQRITAETANPLIEVPIMDAYVPNVVVSFVAVKGGDAEGSRPDVRIGMVLLEVDPASRLLTVTVTPECEVTAQSDGGLCTYGPGDRATLTVRAQDASGAPVDAEVALAVVDKAVLALAADNTVTPEEAFYATRPLGVVTGDSLLVLHNRLADDLEALQLRGERIARESALGGIGGGAGAGDAVFMPDVRQEFPDTALWEPGLRTGSTGEVQVTLRLADSLTTWVADARAVTEGTLVGHGTAEFIVTRPLLVRPVTPRFFIAGDQADVAALVHNNTATELEVAVRLESNLEMAPSGEHEVRIPAGGRVRVAWTVNVPDGGLDAALLTFSASGGGYRDAARPSVGREPDHALPIYRYESPDVVSTSGALTGAGSPVEVVLVPTEAGSASSLTVRIQPTLAAGMLESLSYLERFPHQCTEQLVSRFLPNAVTARALRDLNVPNPELEAQLRAVVPGALEELYSRQTQDGGWGWWQERSSDLQVSAYATFGLIQAQRAGFDVSAQRLARATGYLQRQLRQRVETKAGSLPQAFALYVLAEAGVAWPEGVDAALLEAREDLDVTGRAYLALALGVRDADDPRVTPILESLRADAEITASGAHWESIVREHWITWTRATSVVVDAFARLAPEDPLLPQAVRWLMTARSRDRWETTQETAWAVIALTDYMLATGELSAAYDWGVALNAEALSAGTVSPETMMDPVELTVPVNQLLRDWPNALEISRGEGSGTLYYTADLVLTLPAEELTAESRGLTVERRYCVVDVESLSQEPGAERVRPPCDPVTSARPGDLIEVRLTLILPRPRHYLVLEDFYPAGMEPVDPSLRTEQEGTDPTLTADRRSWWAFGFDHHELRDERALFYANRLSAGTYEVRYYLRAAIPGSYQVIPATASEMYFPEVWGRSEGARFVVAP
jgi:alpha-2-macroglobulin